MVTMVPNQNLNIIIKRLSTMKIKNKKIDYKIFIISLFLNTLFIPNCNESRVSINRINIINELKYPVRCDNGLYGYIINNGELIINPKFKFAKYFVGNCAIVIDTNGKQGIIDINGNYLIYPDYDYIDIYNDLYVGHKNNLNYFIDNKQKLVKSFNFDIVTHWKDNLFVICKNNLFGIADSKLNIIVPTMYELILTSYKIPRNDLCIFKYAIIRTKGKEGFIDSKGRIVIEPKFDIVMPFFNGYARINNNGKWGVIRENGELVVNPILENIWCELNLNKEYFRNNDFKEKRVNLGLFDFSDDNFLFSERPIFNNGLTPFQQNNKWGYFDSTGEIIIKPKYQKAKNFSEGLAAVKFHGKWGYINNNDELVVINKYNAISRFKNGSAFVKYNNKWQIINKNGELLIQMFFDNAEDFTLGLPFQIPLIKISMINASNNEVKYGLIDRFGKVILYPKFDNIIPEDTMMVRVNLMNNEGMYNIYGKEIIHPIYNYLCYFSESLAGFEKNVNGNMIYGFVNPNGEETVIKNLTSCPVFRGDLALTYSYNKIGYINKKGRWIFGPY